MNYPVYNPYLYNPYGLQQSQQPGQMSQAVQAPGAPSQQQAGGAMPQGLSQVSRPVTSREEAMGVAADFSGALMVFPDVTHNRVYIKRWNYQSGGADFMEFAPAPPAPPQQEPQDQAAFASLEDLQSLRDTVNALQQELERLKKPPPASAKNPVKREKADE